MFKIIFALVTLSADEENSVIKFNIFMFIIYAEVVRDSIWKEMWKNIIHVKLTVLTANKTWKETVSPKKINIVISKWVFKLKLNTDEFLNKFKTKFVTKDFLQTYNVNYKNIFTLIIKFNTLQVFLVIVALKNLKCHSVNVNNIFIKFFLKKTIYITLSFKVNITFNHILHILCSLYNLKQIMQN